MNDRGTQNVPQAKQRPQKKLPWRSKPVEGFIKPLNGEALNIWLALKRTFRMREGSVKKDLRPVVLNLPKAATL